VQGVAYKKFAGPDGSSWQVWRVLPTAAERRQGQRRKASAAGAALYKGPERRVNPDRRSKVTAGRTVVGHGLEHGWLCFESDAGEKRRLVPVPENWEQASPQKLWLWCRAATVNARGA
jgi:hypothetical protein